MTVALCASLWCTAAYATQKHASAQSPGQPVQTIVSTQKRYRIPFELSPIDHILLRARVNGHGPFLFILDTGAPTVFLSPAAAKRCGVIKGTTSRVVLNSFHLEGGLRMRNVTGAVQELAQLQGMNNINLTGEHLDGVIGFTLLAQFRLHIDLSRSHLIFTPTGWMPHIQTLDSLPAAQRNTLQAGADKSQQQMRDLAKMAGSFLSPAQNVTTTRRPFYGIQFSNSGQPASIASVIHAAPAWSAGLQPGDQIVRVWFPGKPPINITSTMAAIAALNRATNSAGVVVVVLRDGLRKKFTVVPNLGGF